MTLPAVAKGGASKLLACVSVGRSRRGSRLGDTRSVETRSEWSVAEASVVTMPVVNPTCSWCDNNMSDAKDPIWPLRPNRKGHMPFCMPVHQIKWEKHMKRMDPSIYEYICLPDKDKDAVIAAGGPLYSRVQASAP